jgi:hypothetical protein
VSEIPHVALDEGFYVVCVPGVSSLWRTVLDHWVAAADYALRQLLTEASAMPECLCIAEEGAKKGWASALELDL